MPRSSNIDKEEVFRLAFEEGMTRKQIAAHLNVAYPRIQRILQGVPGVKVEPPSGGVPYGTGSPLIKFRDKEMPRSEAARVLASEGRTITDIAETLGTSYQAAYEAVKRGNVTTFERNRPYTVFQGKKIPTSIAIRTLWERGYDKMSISKYLNVPYSTVSNTIERTAREDSNNVDEVSE